MKLLLTSAGLKTKELSHQARQALPQAPQDCRAVLISYSAPEEEVYVQEAKQELIDLGISTILAVNMRHPVDVSSLGQADVVYMCGGNTFHILSKLRETGLYEYVEQQVQAGALYIGVSAGTLLAMRYIGIADWGSEGDKNEIGLTDLFAFGWTDLVFFPHFRPDLNPEVEDFEDRFGCEVVRLTDTQGVFISDGTTTRIG